MIANPGFRPPLPAVDPWIFLPCLEPGKRPPGGFPQTGRLRGISASDPGGVGARADAEPASAGWGGIDGPPRILDEGIRRRGDRAEFVNAPMTEAECEAMRLLIRRNRAYGSESWARSTAARLGVAFLIWIARKPKSG